MRISGKPTTINGTLTLANTEYEITLPLNTHAFTIKTREQAELKIAYVVGESVTNYITIPSNNIYWEDGLRTNNHLYVQSPTAGTIVEIITWSGGDDL